MDNLGFYESTEEQVKEELAAIYKRMNDPIERKKYEMKMRRETYVKELNDDAGL